MISRDLTVTTLAALMGLTFALPTHADPWSASADLRVLPFRVVPAHVLAKQRGGFLGAEGLRLQLSLNLKQMVYVNDELVSAIRVNLQDMATGLHADMNALRNQLQAQKEQIKAQVEAVDRALDGGGSTAKQVGYGRQDTPSTPVNQDARPTETPPTVVTRSTSDGRSNVVVVQNGPGNSVDASGLRGFGGGALTVIQNSLSNQAIRQVMELDVTLSGLRNLRKLEMLGNLNLQLRGAGK